MSRKPEDVDARDYMIKSLFTGKNHVEVAQLVGLDRTSIYAALYRFNYRFETNREYKKKYLEFLNNKEI